MFQSIHGGGGRDEDDSEFKLVSSVVQEVGLQRIFPFERFNAMQSIVAEQVFHTDCNMAIAAPTGSGKTVLHELAILRLFQDQMKCRDGEEDCDEDANTKLNTVSKANRVKSKVIFIAPTKALCQQRLKEWQKFKELHGLRIVEVTGDSSPADSLKELGNASIIITTPEKWDSITRQWHQHIFLLGRVSLLLLDEIHNLGESRGACLEAVVMRTKHFINAYRDKFVVKPATSSSSSAASTSVTSTSGGICRVQDADVSIANAKAPPPLRIIALSATLPNVEDIGKWLKCPVGGIHYFDETFRPVPLEVRCVTYPMTANSNEYLFDRKLMDNVAGVVKKYSQGKGTIVFCHSVAQTRELASKLLDNLGKKAMDRSYGPDQQVLCNSINDEHLKLLAKKGYAYHNSTLSPNDRASVESLFSCGWVRVLCSTTTLAHGMNLPAYCVVIKGTKAWRGSSYTTIHKTDLIQMMGRAGRPGCNDEKGIAIIMTDEGSSDPYQAGNSDPLSADQVESQLESNILEIICAEVAEKVITDTNNALQWLKTSFYYLRLKSNPQLYKIDMNFDIANFNEEIDAQLLKACASWLATLSSEGIIKYNELTGAVSSCVETDIMSKQIVRFPSMVALLALPPTCSIQQLLMQLSSCEELHRNLKRDEKKPLNEVAKRMSFPYKSKESVKTPQDKTYVLLQVSAGRMTIQNAKDNGLSQDQELVADGTSRLLVALIDLAVQRKQGGLLEAAMHLKRSLLTGIWSGVEGLTGQISSIFLQIRNLSVSLKAKLRDLSSGNYVSQYGLQHVVSMKLAGNTAASFGCSDKDAFELERFTSICQASARKISVDINAPALNGQKNIQVKLIPIFDEISISAGSQGGISSWLFCFDILSGQLLFHLKIDPVTRYFNTHVPIPSYVSPSDVKTCLFSACVGLDSFETSYSSVQQQPQPSAKAKTRAEPRVQKKPNAMVQSTLKQSMVRKPKPASEHSRPPVNASTSAPAPNSAFDSSFNAVSRNRGLKPVQQPQSQNLHKEFAYSSDQSSRTSTSRTNSTSTAEHQLEFDEMIRAEAEAAAAAAASRTQAQAQVQAQARTQTQAQTQVQGQVRRRQELELIGGFGTVKRLRPGEATSIVTSPVQQMQAPGLSSVPQQISFFSSSQQPPQQQQQQEQYYETRNNALNAAVVSVSPDLQRAASIDQSLGKQQQQQQFGLSLAAKPTILPKANPEPSNFDDQFF